MTNPFEDVYDPENERLHKATLRKSQPQKMRHKGKNKGRYGTFICVDCEGEFPQSGHTQLRCKECYRINGNRKRREAGY